MELKNYLETLYDYNYWANKRYLAVAETLTEEQLFHKHGHSWDSIHAIFVHMMSSERCEIHPRVLGGGGKEYARVHC